MTGSQRLSDLLRVTDGKQQSQDLTSGYDSSSTVLFCSIVTEGSGQITGGAERRNFKPAHEVAPPWRREGSEKSPRGWIEAAAL